MHIVSYLSKRTATAVRISKEPPHSQWRWKVDEKRVVVECGREKERQAQKVILADAC